MKFAILGLGEAGSHFANDLVSRGHQVKGWDPNLRYPLNEKVEVAQNNLEAVKEVDIVFSANEKEAVLEIANEVLPNLNENQYYCEMNTISPVLKQQVASVLYPSGVKVIDVSIMAPVPLSGIDTPFLVSGFQADDFYKLTKSIFNIDYKTGEIGTAAGYKLMRSIVYKGVAAVVCEAMDIAESVNEQEYMRQQIKSILGSDELIDRFVTGSKKHANRRMKEMDAVCDFIQAHHKKPIMSKATYENLKKLNNDV